VATPELYATATTGAGAQELDVALNRFLSEDQAGRSAIAEGRIDFVVFSGIPRTQPHDVDVADSGVAFCGKGDRATSVTGAWHYGPRTANRTATP
jgi:hypothetical protein